MVLPHQGHFSVVAAIVSVLRLSLEILFRAFTSFSSACQPSVRYSDSFCVLLTPFDTLCGHQWEKKPMDLVLKLSELRRMRGLTQKDVARLSGVGAKTISSFETGQRITSLKLSQLERLLA